MKIQIERTRITIPYNGGMVLVDGEGSLAAPGQSDYSVYLDTMVWKSPDPGTPVTGEDKMNVRDLILKSMREEGLAVEFLGR